jgi:DNA-binding MarR family transcriptional regulator
VSASVEDVVRHFGYLTLGTRLRRIGERMQAQTQKILEAHELSIPAAQFPFLAAIDRLGPLTVGALAEATGVSQPLATRTLAQLAEAGLVGISQASDDQRRKLASLTKQGQRLVERGKRTAWPLIEAAVKEVCSKGSGSLLDRLDQLEDSLASMPLELRAAAIQSRRR